MKKATFIFLTLCCVSAFAQPPAATIISSSQETYWWGGLGFMATDSVSLFIDSGLSSIGLLTNGQSGVIVNDLTIKSSSNTAAITFIGNPGTGGATQTIIGQPNGLNVAGALINSGVINANGSGLTALPAAQLTGTVPLAQLPATVVSNGQNMVIYYASKSGLKQDGLSDDSAALQTVLNLSSNNPIELVMDGTNLAACKNIVIHSHTKITGKSQTQTGFRLLANCNDWLISDDFSTNSTPSNRDISMQNLLIDGNLQPMKAALTNISSHFWTLSNSNVPTVFNTTCLNKFVWFSSYDGLVIRDCTFSNPPSITLALGGFATNTLLENITISLSPGGGQGFAQDGIHVYGDNSAGICKNLRAININDNIFCLACDENNWIALGQTGPPGNTWQCVGGHISNWTFDGVRLEGTPECGARIVGYSSTGQFGVDNILIRDWKDNGLTQGPTMEAGQFGSAYFPLNNLTMRDIESQGQDALLDFSTCYAHNLNINNFSVVGSPGATGLGDGTNAFIVLNRADTVNLSGLNLQSTASNTVIVADYGYVTNLLISSSQITGTSGTNPVALVCVSGSGGAGSFSNLTVSGVTLPPGCLIFTNKTTATTPQMTYLTPAGISAGNFYWTGTQLILSNGVDSKLVITPGTNTTIQQIGASGINANMSFNTNGNIGINGKFFSVNPTNGALTSSGFVVTNGLIEDAGGSGNMTIAAPGGGTIFMQSMSGDNATVEAQFMTTVHGYFNFVYSTIDQLPVFQLPGNNNAIIYSGSLTNPFGGGILQHDFASTNGNGASITLAIQTNSVGPHGYNLQFTNGIYIGNSQY